ncbi:unnamed protein product [Symbiodinium microadriaticum]|nr:unnamed protein product [Symbiodinium microadriaticum]
MIGLLMLPEACRPVRRRCWLLEQNGAGRRTTVARPTEIWAAFDVMSGRRSETVAEAVDKVRRRAPTECPPICPREAIAGQEVASLASSAAGLAAQCQLRSALA